MINGIYSPIPDAAGRSPIFGHKSFEPGQQEAIESILSGEDTIVLTPNGGGKTIIYTLSVVVSPLIMLTDDQVTILCKYGVNLCFYNTTSSETEHKNILQNGNATHMPIRVSFCQPKKLL